MIVTSALTITEVIWLKNKPRLAEDKENILNDYFKNSYIRLVNLDRTIAQRARRLVWEYQTKPKDSIHVATALHYECPIMETFDNELISRTSGLDNLIVREPQTPSQGSLKI